MSNFFVNNPFFENCKIKGKFVNKQTNRPTDIKKTNSTEIRNFNNGTHAI